MLFYRLVTVMRMRRYFFKLFVGYRLEELGSWVRRIIIDLFLYKGDIFGGCLRNIVDLGRGKLIIIS